MAWFTLEHLDAVALVLGMLLALYLWALLYRLGRERDRIQARLRSLAYWIGRQEAEERWRLEEPSELIRALREGLTENESRLRRTRVSDRKED